MSKELKKWMPMFWPEYLADTGHLSTTEHGAYVLLIAHYWMKGGVPWENEELVRRITRLSNVQWAHSRDVLRSFFGDDGRHKRIDEELAYAIEKSKRLSANAKHRHSNGKAIADTPTPTPTPTKKEVRKKDTGKMLLPGSWSVSVSHYELGKKLGLEEGEIGEAAAEMRDWSIGNREMRSNWDSVFNNWMRRNAAKKGRRHGTTGGNVILAADRLKEKIAEFNRPGGSRPSAISPTEAFGGEGDIRSDQGENIIRLLPDGGRE